MSNRVELGRGSYGTVIAPALPNEEESETIEYPDDVTKIFFDKKACESIQSLSGRLKDIMGENSGHRISSYCRTLKGSNLPNQTRVKMRANALTNIYAVRMPNLGVDLHHVPQVYKQIRQIPVSTIIRQIVKLLTQVDKLRETGYIHGDIRPPNIMIHPTTGVFTLIDFDWLRPIADFETSYPLLRGFYNNPPECVLHDVSSWNFDEMSLEEFNTHIHHMLNHDKTLRQILEHYAEDVAYEYTHLEKLLDQIKSMLPEIVFFNMMVLFKEYKNKKSSSHRLFHSTLRTFDSFGLANSLVGLLHYLYPGITEPNQFVFFDSLRKRITKGNQPYSKNELNASGKALHRMVHEILLPLGNFELSNRMRINTALDNAKLIESELTMTLRGIERQQNVNSMNKERLLEGNVNAVLSERMPKGGRRTRHKASTRSIRRNKKTLKRRKSA